MPKQTKVQEYVAKEKKEYTVKVTSIIKVIIVAAIIVASFITGWNARSDFSNEVTSEVRKQYSILKEADTVKTSE